MQIVAPRPTAAPQVEASAGQRRAWLLQNLFSDRSVHNVSAAIAIDGKLDADLLHRSILNLVRRHLLFRTAFAFRGGRLFQDSRDDVEPALRRLAFPELPESERSAKLGEICRAEGAAPFDCEQPLCPRFTLVSWDGAHAHHLLVTMHRLVCDPWVPALLVHELGRIYASVVHNIELPSQKYQHADFCRDQAGWLGTKAGREALGYWRDVFADGGQSIDLPLDLPRPPVLYPETRCKKAGLSASAWRSVKALATRMKTTPPVVFTAVLFILLHRYTGDVDITVGMQRSRRREGQWQELLGPIGSMLAVRARLQAEASIEQLINLIAANVGEAERFGDVAFENVVEAVDTSRELNRHPLFQVSMRFREPTPCFKVSEETAFQYVHVDEHQIWCDLDLEVAAGPGEPSLALRHNGRIIGDDTARRMLARYCRLLEGAVADPARPVNRLPILSDAERRTAIETWNRTARPADGLPLHERIELALRERGEEEAIVAENAALSCLELSRRTNQLSRLLREMGAGPGVLVGVCIERSVEMVVALLAVLKSGAAYLPINPEHPEKFIADVLSDARPTVVITHGTAAAALPDDAGPVLHLDRDKAQIDLQPDTAPAPVNTAGDLAYVMYTSGSTGLPKGVMIEHRGICNRLSWMQATYGIGPGDRVLQKTPVTFDVSVWEIFLPLLSGATLVLARPGGQRDPAYLVDFVRRHAITVMHFVPSMLPAFVAVSGVAACVSLRHVFASGEALYPELVQQFAEKLRCPLHNLYGPTEASIDVTHWTCKPVGRRATVPIGGPIWNTTAHILDDNREPVPVGVIGELHLGGIGLARGYLNQPALTADKFIHHRFDAGGAATRLYRTGDRCRYLPDGLIEFVGRTDSQVKVLGHRIELGEVEAALSGHPGVVTAAVAVFGSPGTAVRLVAYVVPKAAAPSASILRSFLAAILPAAMIPAEFIALPRLPLGPSGKLDRNALPEPTRSRPLTDGPRPEHRNWLEQRIATIWGDCLGLRQFGMQDDFFDLGGNSLLMMAVQCRLDAELGHRLSVVELFAYPTVRALASYLEQSAEQPSFDAIFRRAELQRMALSRITTTAHREQRRG